MATELLTGDVVGTQFPLLSSGISFSGWFSRSGHSAYVPCLNERPTVTGEIMTSNGLLLESCGPAFRLPGELSESYPPHTKGFADVFSLKNCLAGCILNRTYQQVFLCKGRAIAQVARRRLLTSENRVQFRVTSSEISGERSGSGSSLSPSSSVPPS
jgi:hypothetical protein